jgi:ATP-dependent DNA helicase RecG
LAEDYLLTSEQVTEQVKRLLVCLGDNKMSIKEIMGQLKLKHRPTLLYDYIQPAIESELIEMTQPDSPKRPSQKYRLTKKGLEFKNS